jgi:hypothetical protein
VVRGVTVNLSQITFNLTGCLDNSAADNPQSGGTLALDASTGPLYLDGGRIYQGTITTSGGDDLVAATAYSYISYGGTLDGVTLDGTLDMTQVQGAGADVINGLTLNGTIELGGASNSAELIFDDAGDDGAETLGGTGTIQFGQASTSDTLDTESAATITFGPKITIQAGLNSVISAATGAFDNQGTITEDQSGGQLTITAVGWVNDSSIEVGDGASATLEGQHQYLFQSPTVAPWTNNGTITAAAGTTLNLYGGWTNNGTITVQSTTVGLGSPININPTAATAVPYVWTNRGTLTIADGATVNLGGIITTDEYDDSFAAAGVAVHLPMDTVNLTGSMDNSAADNPVSGGVLALGPSTGPLYLAGGRIHQGMITTSGAHDLVATPAVSPNATPGPDQNYVISGTLDGVTLDGTLDMSQYGSGPPDVGGGGAKAVVINGLTLNGLIELGGTAGSYDYGSLAFGMEDDYVAQTVGGTGTIQFGQDSAGDSLGNLSNDTLTFGPNITIQGGLNSSIVGNDYTNSSYGTFFHGPIENQGTIEDDTSGGHLFANIEGGSDSTFANYSAGTLTGGTWEISNGAMLSLGNYAPVNTNAATILVSGAK